MKNEEDTSDDVSWVYMKMSESNENGSTIELHTMPKEMK